MNSSNHLEEGTTVLPKAEFKVAILINLGKFGYGWWCSVQSQSRHFPTNGQQITKGLMEEQSLQDTNIREIGLKCLGSDPGVAMHIHQIAQEVVELEDIDESSMIALEKLEV